MLAELVEWQKECGYAFREARKHNKPSDLPKVNPLQLMNLDNALGSGDLAGLDSLLDAYNWIKLDHGLMGRKSPAVEADVGLNVYLDEEDRMFLGIYSLTTNWDSVAGPAWIGVRKIKYSIPLMMDGEENGDWDIYEMLVYFTINHAASKSKMVMMCESCGRPGPGWELKFGPCSECVPRVY